MPLYEYECQQCNHRFEKIQSFSAAAETVCPQCGGKLEKLISAPAIQFKGAGWYVSDYSAKGAASKKASSAESSGGSDATSPASGGDKGAASGSEAKSSGEKSAGDASPAKSSGGESAMGSPSGSGPATASVEKTR